MTTLTKFLVALIISITLMSCHFDFDGSWGVRGNGDVETMERNINSDFDEIKVSRGLDVYLTQADDVSLEVQADSNLHDIIMTEVENGVLRIYADENISYAASQKVMVSFPDIESITATSGSDVFSTNTLRVDDISLTTTSGADMEVDVDANLVDCKSTSGSDLRVSGSAKKLYAEATSGSDIKAGNLKARVCDARASSGADVTVHSSEELIAKASSGGDIKYYGNPEKISKKDGVSGSIRKQ